MAGNSVLLILECCQYGSARHVSELAEGLVERDWRVGLIYSPTRRTDRTFDAALERLGGNPNFRSFPCPMTLWPGPADIGTVRSILRIMRAWRPDVVHCHSIKAGFVGRIAAAIHGTPGVYTPHAPLSMKPSLPYALRVLSEWYEACFARLGDVFIALSDEEKRCARALGVPEARIRLIHNGVPIPPLPPGPLRLETRARFGLSPDEICVGFVGRITSQKAIDNLLHGWRLVNHSSAGPALKLVIVGDGALRADMQSLSTRLGQEASVLWPGEFPGWEAMAAFDLFVLPSDFEGMPYVLLEAMAARLPIVTTEVGGAKELVSDGVNGRVVPRRAPKALADAIAEITRSEELRDAMGAASRRRVAAFSLDRMLDSVIETYRETILLRQGVRRSVVTSTHA